MGMAASQARYLGLAARKTNCEYQGQQINQARTALGNQSAELWNQMLGLSVPVVPNQEDYVTTSYSFSDGINNFEITSMVPTDEEDGYNYAVKYRYYEQEIKGIEAINTNPQAKYTVITNTGGEITGDNPPTGSIKTDDGVEPLTQVTDKETFLGLRSQLESAGVTFKKDGTDPDSPTADGNTKIFMTSSGKYYVALTNQTAKDVTYYTDIDLKLGNTQTTIADTTDPNTNATLKKIAEDNPDSKIAKAIKNGEDIYQYVKNGVTYYACYEDVINSVQNTTAEGEISKVDKQAGLKQYYTSQVQIEKTESAYALMDDASGSGRFSSIKLSNYNTDFTLNTETRTNEEAYNNAMNQYYYETQQYEKTNADINAKTSIIQQQDRTLELRLRQLDTEHNALQTEMEAVKKVMDKNVEDTFKTFNG